MKCRILLFLFVTLVFKVYSQSCTLTVNITASNSAICSGNPVVLTAGVTAGTPGYNYVWSTGETAQTINVNKVGTYTVTVTDQGGCQTAKSISLTSGTVPDAPTAADGIACPNTSAQLIATGPGGTYQWYDAPTGGRFLATGAVYNTPPITTKTIFYVETTISGCASARTAVTVYPIAGPSTTGGTTCPGSTVVLTAVGAGSYQWYDAASGGNLVGTGASYITPPLTTTKTYYAVGITNDCVSAPTPATATVLPAPDPPVSANTSTCSGSSVNLHAASSAGAVFDWFSVPTGGTSIISSPDYTTPILTATTTYYVQATINGCIGPRTSVTVTVNPVPVAPTVAGVSICSGSSGILTAAVPGGTYQWYANPTATTPLFTGDYFTTPVLNSNTTYYVEVVSAGCTSPRTAVTVNVNPSPTAPTVAGQSICAGNTVTLTATGPGGSYEWYDLATGGTPVFTGNNFTTPVLTVTTTYYVQTTIAGCISPRTAVTVTATPVPGAPTATGATICAGLSALLTATGNGASYEWYNAVTGGTLLASTQNFITPSLSANTTYYVQTLSNGCVSPRTAVTVTVNPLPPAPTASGTTVCAGTPASLTATNVAEWYDAPSGGTLLFSGNTYNTPVLAATTTYYIQTNNGTCVSSRNAVTVNVTSTVNQFNYSSGTYCTSATTTTPVINVTGGTFSASPAGLTINSTTGQITLTTSLIGTYTITYTNTCAITSKPIAIVVTPDASFSYSVANYCQGGANAAAHFTNPSSSGGIFSASPAGLVFLDTQNGIINMAASAPGTYSIINTIDGAGGCPTVVSAPVSVTIDPKVNISAGPNQTVALNTPVQLAGSVSGGATTGVWTGGAGTFSNPSVLNAIYTPAAGETSVTLTLTSANPGTTCGPQISTINITFSALPSPPTSPNTSVCLGSAVALTASAPGVGHTYQWYNAATGGTLLASTPTYVVAPSAATIYYVQTTVSGITSNRTAVTVTVNAIPAAPTATGAAICSGNTATLSASGSAGTYEWYDALNGGNLLFGGPGNTYTTTNLTANTSYYVQTTVNGCSSIRKRVDVTVNPLPTITSVANFGICSNNDLNYTITADIAATTFTWSRATVPGISNAAAVNQTGNTITETLINTTGANLVVTYIIVPTLNGCQGAPFNYKVTVYPIALVTSPATAVICSGVNNNYNITFNTTGILVSWSRAAVAGVSNLAISGQNSSAVQEALINTTTTPIDVTYIFTYSTINCAGSTFSLKVTVNPKVFISSPAQDVACGGTLQNYVITSNVPSAIYTWSRPAVPGISNAAVSNNVGNSITETLINTGTTPVTVHYYINTLTNGCQTEDFHYSVLVNPQPPTPIANSNSPVCSGKDINLLTPTILAGATYMWIGPNGFSSSLKNPILTSVATANAGTYTLYVIVNNCSSVGASVDVAVDAVPVANAGPDQVVCISTPIVNLAGNVGGGTTTGVWTTSGTGTFSPSAGQLNGQYLPSAQDKANGVVKLTLASTSKDDCNISTDEMTIKFQPVPAADAGADQAVCNQGPVNLAGSILISGNGTWSTSGTGTFAPSVSQIKDSASPIYIPSAADIAAGTVTLTLTANLATSCDIPSDQMIVTLISPPKVNAGGTRYVLKGNTIVLNPTVSESNVTYLWTPNVFINNNTIKNPTITGDVDKVYTLRVTDSRGCITTNYVQVIVSPKISIPNTFTPNNDGINDLWEIQGLVAYPNATIDVFDRYGQKVYHSVGYGKNWDGTYNDNPLPFGTYYYLIDAKLYNQVYSGSVTIVK